MKNAPKSAFFLHTSKKSSNFAADFEFYTYMLKNILSITGKPGLYKLISQGNNMLIVESLVDGKRMPTYARDKIVSLGEISMYTIGEDIALSEVLTKLGEKEGLKTTTIDPKKASNDELHAFFAEVLPEYDRDRVYPSDIRKLIQWYNILVGAGITEFTAEEEGAEAVVEEKKQEVKKPAPKQQVKTQKAAASSARTGVGSKKG
jgi:hypothetical protein